MGETSKQNRPVQVFCSYSHNDENYRVELEKSLVMLKRQKKIENWHDRMIGPGTEWRGQISEHLERADLILLLISREFLHSDYCYDTEMTKAMEKHEKGEARVVPIILRPSDWKEAPFSKLQALPRDGKPVSTWPDQDEAYLNIVEGLKRVIAEIMGT